MPRQMFGNRIRQIAITHKHHRRHTLVILRRVGNARNAHTGDRLQHLNQMRSQFTFIGSSGGHTGFEFLAAKNPGQSEIITLARADGQAFDFSSFEFHGWNNNFAPSITVSAIKDGGVVFSQTFAITNTNTQPWQFASLADGFAGVDAVTFAAPVQPVGVFALDNLTASVSGAVPEPATWAMMILGFGAVGAGLRRRGGQAFA